MTGRVLVVGSVNIDLVIAGARLPAPGETVLGGTFRRFHGGKGGNQAVAAARLGADVAFVGAVGDDPFGDEACAGLETERIDVSELLRVGGVATGVALILVDGAGENLISVAAGANASLTADTVWAALERLRPTTADVVLVGLGSRPGPSRPRSRAQRGRAHAGILNPAPADGLEQRLLPPPTS